ncbi:MAG: hypothetical protein IT474_05120 [Arenimonas sp.]|nr:hypothetical protein [Arenimonas sp.]
MKTLVIHIGSAKAGSSSIQQALANAQDAGFDFIQSHDPGLPTHALLGALYLPHEHLPGWIRLNFPDAESLEAARAGFWQAFETRHGGSTRLVMSSEALTHLPPDAIARLRQDFERRGVRAFRIVFYVREPVDYYRSLLQEHLKHDTRTDWFHPTRFRCRIKAAALQWRAAFPDALTVAAFDRATLHDHCVVADFRQQLSRAFGIEIAPLDAGRQNESIGLLTLFCLHNALRHRPERSPESVRRGFALMRELERLAPAQPPIRLHPHIARAVARRHAEDLEWLAAEYGIRFTAWQGDGDATPRMLSDPPRLAELVVPPHPRAVIQLLGRAIASKLFGSSSDAG